MKTIDTYITEKLHLAKDMKKVYYILILQFLSRYNVYYKICNTTEEVVAEIKKHHLFHNVYKMYDLDKLDDLIKSFWDVTGETTRTEYLRKLDIECCTDEIRELL